MKRKLFAAISLTATVLPAIASAQKCRDGMEQHCSDHRVRRELVYPSEQSQRHCAIPGLRSLGNLRRGERDPGTDISLTVPTILGGGGCILSKQRLPLPHTRCCQSSISRPSPRNSPRATSIRLAAISDSDKLDGVIVGRLAATISAF